MCEYDHSDVCHCSDWQKDICPNYCFRARVTKDYRESDYPYPVTFSSFKGQACFCPLSPGKTQSYKVLAYE